MAAMTFPALRPDAVSTLDPAMPSNAPLTFASAPVAGGELMNPTRRPKAKARGKRKRTQAAPINPLARAPERPGTGYEQFVSEKADGMTGRLHVNSRGARYRGGKSPDQVLSTLEAQYAGMTDEEKDYWTQRANMTHVRGPLDRALNDAYQGGGDGRSLSNLLYNGGGGASGGTGGAGFTGVAGAGRGQQFQLRTPDQVAARIASSPVTVTGKPLATIRQPQPSMGMTSAMAAEYASRVDPKTGKVTMPTAPPQPSAPMVAAATPQQQGPIVMNDRQHMPDRIQVGGPVAAANDTMSGGSVSLGAGQSRMTTIPKVGRPAPTIQDPVMARRR